MMLLLGVLGIAMLFSFGLQGVHDFFQPPSARSKPAKGRVATPWGPRPSIKAKERSALGPSDFWTQLDEAIERDPMVLGFLPREDSATPLNGWNQTWTPAHTLTSGSAWGPSPTTSRLPAGRSGLRDANGGTLGKM